MTTPSPTLPPAILADKHPDPTHCGINLDSFYVKSALALFPPLAAGAVLFGWRAVATIGIILASTLAGTALWRFIGQRGKSMHWTHGIYLSILLCFLLPADLARANDGLGIGYTLLVAAGLTLATVYWLLGGLGARIHPVAVTSLLLLGLFPGPMTPTAVLSRDFLFKGDVLRSASAEPAVATDPLLSLHTTVPAIRTEPASSRLTDFTRGRPPADGTSISLDILLRDRLPPLEDLLVGGSPTPIGLGSLAAMLLGGLLLLRNGTSWRTPTLVILSSLVCLVTLRLPIVVTSAGAVYRWLPLRTPGVSWETMTTFALYELAAGPLVFTAFFLAPAGASSPTSRTGQTAYALLLGAGSAAGQLYISVPAGPLLALAVVSLLSPLIDRAFRPRPVL